LCRAGISALPLSSCLSPRIHRDAFLSIVVDSWRISTSPSKTKNARFSTEGRKAVTCYSVGSTRRSASPKCTEAPNFPPRLLAGESSLPSVSVGIPAPPLSGNLLLCSCQEAACQYAQRPSTPYCA
jgi:hypothetical protein